MTGGALIAQVVTCVLLLGFMTTRVTCSAIPMWEFLSKDEKMSHLYGLFSKQVARFCADSSRPDCNKNLLVSGIRSLANMDENVLDKLDPYQRGAKGMIWRAMVGSDRVSSRISPAVDEPYFTAGTDLSASSGSETNGLGEETSANDDYVSSSSSSEEHSGPYLIGPMVIRVYPDGRPVLEERKPLPRDEDADELRYSRLPSIEEIEVNSGGVFYGKGAKELTKRPPFVTEKNPRRLDGSARRFRGNPYERRTLRGTVREYGPRYY